MYQQPHRPVNGSLFSDSTLPNLDLKLSPSRSELSEPPQSPTPSYRFSLDRMSPRLPWSRYRSSSQDSEQGQPPPSKRSLPVSPRPVHNLTAAIMPTVRLAVPGKAPSGDGEIPNRASFDSSRSEVSIKDRIAARFKMFDKEIAESRHSYEPPSPLAPETDFPREQKEPESPSSSKASSQTVRPSAAAAPTSSSEASDALRYNLSLQSRCLTTLNILPSINPRSNMDARTLSLKTGLEDIIARCVHFQNLDPPDEGALDKLMEMHRTWVDISAETRKIFIDERINLKPSTPSIQSPLEARLAKSREDPRGHPFSSSEDSEDVGNQTFTSIGSVLSSGTSFVSNGSKAPEMRRKAARWGPFGDSYKKVRVRPVGNQTRSVTT